MRIRPPFLNIREELTLRIKSKQQRLIKDIEVLAFTIYVGSLTDYGVTPADDVSTICLAVEGLSRINRRVAPNVLRIDIYV